MLGGVISLNYLDPGSSLVDVQIYRIMVLNNLIDLGVGMNLMTKETMLKLNLPRALRETTTVIQFVDRSRVAPKGVIKDVMFSIDSWEYLIDFVVVQTKTKFNGYPLILGRLSLDTIDSYISCRPGNMTIKNEHLSEQIVLYPTS